MTLGCCFWATIWSESIRRKTTMDGIKIFTHSGFL